MKGEILVADLSSAVVERGKERLGAKLTTSHRFSLTGGKTAYIDREERECPFWSESGRHVGRE